MHSILLYSFRTNPYLESFRSAGFYVFVFGKLKEDIEKFEKHIRNEKPGLIIGLALVKTQTQIETRAVNHFGKTKMIERKGKRSYPLYIPPEIPFPQSQKSTTSFCNWTMYKISEAVDHTNIKVSFIHFNRSDAPKIIHFLKTLQ